MRKIRRTCFALMPACLVLTACGGGADETEVSRLDAKLTENSVDPALREALEAPIATDPDLVGEANRDAVRPADTPLTGTVPARLAVPQARTEALRLAGGKLLQAPAATKSVTSTDDPVTLGGKIAARLDRAACRRVPVDYAAQWSQSLPAALPVYPGGSLMEAAGTDEEGCITRAISFTTPVPASEVLDFYYSMVRRAGYSADHIEQNGEDVLSGRRGKGGAYYLSVKARNGGGTAVDLIADHSR